MFLGEIAFSTLSWVQGKPTELEIKPELTIQHSKFTHYLLTMSFLYTFPPCISDVGSSSGGFIKAAVLDGFRPFLDQHCCLCCSFASSSAVRFPVWRWKWDKRSKLALFWLLAAAPLSCNPFEGVTLWRLYRWQSALLKHLGHVSVVQWFLYFFLLLLQMTITLWWPYFCTSLRWIYLVSCGMW